MSSIPSGLKVGDLETHSIPLPTSIQIERCNSISMHVHGKVWKSGIPPHKNLKLHPSQKWHPDGLLSFIHGSFPTQRTTRVLKKYEIRPLQDSCGRLRCPTRQKFLQAVLKFVWKKHWNASKTQNLRNASLRQAQHAHTCSCCISASPTLYHELNPSPCLVLGCNSALSAMSSVNLWLLLLTSRRGFESFSTLVTLVTLVYL